MTAIDVDLIAKLTCHVSALKLVYNWAWDPGKFDIFVNVTHITTEAK